MNDINLHITIKEGRLIFNALSELPFKIVYELIGKLNQQSNSQKKKQQTDGSAIALKLTGNDLKIISEALSRQPFKEVYEIMDKIHQVK